jgi:hypothetical protein
MWEMKVGVRSEKVKLPKGKMKMNVSQSRRRFRSFAGPETNLGQGGGERSHHFIFREAQPYVD